MEKEIKKLTEREILMIHRLENTKTAAALFADWDESLIWSCIQGVMGGIYAQEEAHPQSAMALLGDFAFLAGKPSMELVSFKPDSCKQNFIIMVPQNEAWAKMIEECYLQRAKKVCRYAIKKEPGIFDREKLKRAAASLPSGYHLRFIDEELYETCRR